MTLIIEIEKIKNGYIVGSNDYDSKKYKETKTYVKTIAEITEEIKTIFKKGW